MSAKNRQTLAKGPPFDNIDRLSFSPRAYRTNCPTCGPLVCIISCIISLRYNMSSQKGSYVLHITSKLHSIGNLWRSFFASITVVCQPGYRVITGLGCLCVVDRMLYWSVGGAAARYIYRTTLDGAAADNVKRFIDVTDNSVSTAAEAAVQDIVIDVTTRRYLENVIYLPSHIWLRHKSFLVWHFVELITTKLMLHICLF